MLLTRDDLFTMFNEYRAKNNSEEDNYLIKLVANNERDAFCAGYRQAEKNLHELAEAMIATKKKVKKQRGK